MISKSALKRIFRLDENFLSRRKWLRQALESIPQGSSILDAGAGQLRNKPLCSHLKYISQDICQYDGVGSGIGLHTGVWNTEHVDIVCDITEMPIDNDEFDCVLCSEVLEHVADPVQVIQELARILKPGGTLILTAPFASLVHFAPYYYTTGFSRYWYEHHLTKLGFYIQTLERNGNWFSAMWQELVRVYSMIPPKNILTKLFSLIYILAFFPLFILVKNFDDNELSCFGWHCVAKKNSK